MAQTTIEGDLVVTGSVVGVGGVVVTDGTVVDSKVQAGANLAASKLEHQYEPAYCQESTTNAAAERKVVHVVKGASGSVVSFHVGAVTAATSTGQVTVDLKKNGTSVLSSPVTLDAATASFALKAGTVSAGTLAAGDVLEVQATSPTGSNLPKGVFARTVIREQAQ